MEAVPDMDTGLRKQMLDEGESKARRKEVLAACRRLDANAYLSSTALHDVTGVHGEEFDVASRVLEERDGAAFSEILALFHERPELLARVVQAASPDQIAEASCRLTPALRTHASAFWRQADSRTLALYPFDKEPALSSHLASLRASQEIRDEITLRIDRKRGVNDDADDSSSSSVMSPPPPRAEYRPQAGAGVAAAAQRTEGETEQAFQQRLVRERRKAGGGGLFGGASATFQAPFSFDALELPSSVDLASMPSLPSFSPSEPSEFGH